MEQDQRRDILLKEYDKVLENFHNLTEIRFKLLAFLPISAVVGSGFVGFQADKVGTHGLVFFLFGLAATIGVAIYNTRNDQLYDELVDRAAEIERLLGLPDGAFAHRPQAWRRVSGVKIDHRTGVGIIYGAS